LLFPTLDEDGGTPPVKRTAVMAVTAMAAMAAGLIAGCSGTGDAAGVDYPYWAQTFADDFSTPVAASEFANSTYRSRWASYDGFADTSGKGRYAAGVLSVRDGALDMYLHTEGDQPLSAAVVPVVDGKWGDQLYGPLRREVSQ
jgi:hypothetical protein